VSASGLWAAWNIGAKATIGLTVSIVLTATTPIPDLIRGLGALRVPAVVTSIMTFMVRYAEVIAAEAHRMRIARLARAHNPRWFWQARAIAHSVGTLFVRSYERGERVHLAMLSRGYVGTMPDIGGRTTPVRDWLAAAAVPAAAAAIALVAVMTR
jgi:cobalt/nickel transport system permease protein